MVTLTGYKAVDAPAAAAAAAGQQNPVFVFDDVDGQQAQQAQQAQDQVQDQEQQVQEQQEQQREPEQTQVQQPTETKNDQPQVHKRPAAASSANSLNPNPNQDESVCLSMLAVDCAGSGTGKSPRTPRRSPLMALFRGKPRESVRRLYTDEDQFEIEWADLSLELQKKWYQKFNLSDLIVGSGDNSAKLEPGSQYKPFKKILNSVDGRIRSGEITAVLGPSGAGKTSLLNGLFGKYRTAVEGNIKVTGAPSKKHLTVCTIPQSDYLIGYLTTEECLWFASRLKNCEHDFDHNKNIERVIELLGLQRCRHTRINKLSGGQYKRVSIAQEMLSSPDILVLDEPTSGLDSLTCYRTVKVLRDLVEASKAHNLVNPMSIILTIHQPHREVLDLFHSIYVMAIGGQTLFQGPPSEMEAAINKFSGLSLPADGYNPASFMVELASEEYGRKPIEQLVEHQRDRFRKSTKHAYSFAGAGAAVVDEPDSAATGARHQQHNSKPAKMSDSSITLYPLDSSNGGQFVDVSLDTTTQSKLVKNIDSRIMTPRSGKNSDGVFWRHVNLMSKRCFLSTTRDPLLFTMRVGAHIFIPLVVALIYGPKMGIPNGCPFYKPEINLLEYASMGVEEIQAKHDDVRIQFQNVGLHFMVYYAFGLCMLAFTAISFPLIMHVLIKEIRNGWYSLGAFVVGKTIAELPLAIVLPPISVGIIYVMTGQPSSYLQWRYMVQSLLLVLIIMIAEAKGLVFGAICMNSMQTAVFAASVSTVPFILLSGFLIRINEIPYVLQGLARFSYFKHSVEALIITRYGFGMCDCDPSLIPAGGSPRIVGIPPQIMSLTDYYISGFAEAKDNNNNTAGDESEVVTETNVLGNMRNIAKIVEATSALPAELTTSPSATQTDTTTTTTTTTPTASQTEAMATSQAGRRRARRQATANKRKRKTTTTTSSTTTTTTTTTTPEPEEQDEEEPPKQGQFFDKLGTLLTRANAFGFSIESCDDVQPFTMKDMKLRDDQLAPLIGYLFLIFVALKFVSYFIVDFCVKLKL